MTDKIREQMAATIKQWHEETVDSYEHLADQILSIKGIYTQKEVDEAEQRGIMTNFSPFSSFRWPGPTSATYLQEMPEWREK